MKRRPIMLSPGRQELAADTRSASTLFQSKSCLRAGRSILVELFRCSFQHIYLYIGRSNDHLVYVSHQECVMIIMILIMILIIPRMCSPGQEFSLWLPGRLCPTCTSSTPILQKNIFNTTENLNGGQIKQNQGHVPASMSSIPLTCSDHQIQAPSQALSE